MYKDLTNEIEENARAIEIMSERNIRVGKQIRENSLEISRLAKEDKICRAERAELLDSVLGNMLVVKNILANWNDEDVN